MLEYFNHINFMTNSLFSPITIFQICRKNHGRCLILDGAIQMTENDEFAYQEMLSMVPVNCHPNPERVGHWFNKYKLIASRLSWKCRGFGDLGDDVSLYLLSLQVLVIGGGDGGIVRELDKHPKVKSIVQCEIDGVCLHLKSMRILQGCVSFCL